MGENMKKIVLIMLILSMLTGCTKNKEQPNDDVDEKREVEQPKQEEEKYIDNNPIGLSFYMYYGQNINRKRLETYQAPFGIGQD